MSTINPNVGTGSVQTSYVGEVAGTDRSQLSIDALIVAVQIARVSTIEKELRDQVDKVDSANKRMQQLRDVRSSIAERLAGFSGTSKPEDTMQTTSTFTTSTTEVNRQAFTKAFTDPSSPTRFDQAAAGAYGKGYQDLAQLAKAAMAAGLDEDTVNKIGTGKATAADLRALDTKITGMIDSASSTQQMDMIRMQALINRRDESISMITNILNKYNTSITGILSNLR